MVLAGCASPVVELPPAPTEEMVRVSGVEAETLLRGRGVYLSNCTRCHEPMMPEDVSREDWHVVVPGMAWNAGVSSADEEAVLAYILAAKKLAEAEERSSR